MNSSDTFAEATQWLIELQMADRLEDVWEEFDAWFQASSAHREAYAKVQRHWLKLAGLPIPSAHRTTTNSPLTTIDRYLFKAASAWMAHWELILAVVLALTVTCAINLRQPVIGAFLRIL